MTVQSRAFETAEPLMRWQAVTSIIHGKAWHEETKATSSRATANASGTGQYLVVYTLAETEYVCRYITEGGSKEEFLEKFRDPRTGPSRTEAVVSSGWIGVIRGQPPALIGWWVRQALFPQLRTSVFAVRHRSKES